MIIGLQKSLILKFYLFTLILNVIIKHIVPRHMSLSYDVVLLRELMKELNERFST